MTREETITKLFETMDIAKRTMHGQMHGILTGSPLSRSHLELLFTIKHLQPISFKQLAQKLQLSPGAISQLADGLDQQQLIERETDPHDRRRQVLRVSKQGIAILKTIEKKRRTVMEHVMQSLSDEELITWLHIQEQMIREFQSTPKQATTRSAA